MDDIWEILGIEPSHDAAVIKGAYAHQTHQYHPEENPEMFLRLRKAYQAAMAYCDSFQQQERAPEEQVDSFPDIFEDQNEDHAQQTKDQIEDIGWQIIAEEQEQENNPYMEHSAHKQFFTLYTGKQRNNPKLWMDYFTSSAFLEVHREPAFTALLLEDVEQQQDNPPGREFLTWLHIAYQFTSSETVNPAIPGGRERQFELRGSGFEGIESIFQIAVRGPVPRQLRGNERAMSISFSDYHFLMRLAEEEAGMTRLSQPPEAF